MRFLAVLFLVGFALASAIPLPSSKNALEDEADDFDVLITLATEVDDGDVKEELKKTLEEAYEKILQKVKDAVEKGKTIKEKYLEKLKDAHQKLKDLKVEISEKAKENLQRIKEKLKEYYDKILERLGMGKRSIDFYTERAFYAEGDEYEEIRKQLREKFDEILQKIKDAIDKGKAIKAEYLEKLKEVREKLKDMKGEISTKAKELLQKIKEKGMEYFKKILEKLGLQKRQVAQADFNIKDMFRKLRDLITDRIDADKLKEKVEKIFGKGSEMADQILKTLKEKGETGKSKILDLIDRVLGDKEQRSIKDVYEKVKNYFKDLKIELKEKFFKFGEWAKAKFEKGLEKGSDRVENLKKLAKQFIEDAEVVGKVVAREARGFFEEYKEDLGNVYDDLKQKFKEISDKK